MSHALTVMTYLETQPCPCLSLMVRAVAMHFLTSATGSLLLEVMQREQ